MNKEQFEALTEALPFAIKVCWDTAPSKEKYCYVNALLAVLAVFQEEDAKFSRPTGDQFSTLEIQPIRHRLTDQSKRNFNIVGHRTSLPLTLAALYGRTFEIFFNHAVMIETATTYRQYFPSAAVIVRSRNFLTPRLTPSPGSWGSDIISMTSDWQGTFFLEAAVSAIPRRHRHHFRGYKLIPSEYKYVVAGGKPQKTEQLFLQRNGMQLIFGAPSVSLVTVKSKVRSYIIDQLSR